MRIRVSNKYFFDLQSKVDALRYCGRLFTLPYHSSILLAGTVMAPAPAPSNPPNFSRIWIVLPLLCGLYYAHLYGLHLQIYSAFQHAYAEHIVHLPIFSVPWDLLTEQAGLGKSQSHLNLEESALKAYSRHIVRINSSCASYKSKIPSRSA